MNRDGAAIRLSERSGRGGCGETKERVFSPRFRHLPGGIQSQKRGEVVGWSSGRKLSF